MAAPKVGDPCIHCSGKLRSAGRSLACGTCGREAMAIVVRPVVTTVAAPRCTVEGCLGVLDAAGRCACCDKRAAWVEANAPKKPCGICGALVKVGRNRKYCDACAVAVAKVQVQKSDKKPAAPA